MAQGIFSSVLFSFINVVPVDAKLSETHHYKATPTDYTLEDGSVVSKHVVLHPRRVLIEFDVNNLDDYVLSPGLEVGLPTSYGIKAAAIFFLLQRIWEKRIPVTIVTRHYLYTNMIVLDLNAVHRAPYTGALRGTIEFQQISQKSLEKLDRPEGQLATDGTQLTASSVLSLGNQGAFTVSDNSAVSNAMADLFGVS